jgi:CheY-like chemotaxis protein
MKYLDTEIFAATQPSSRARLLVVDDDPLLRELHATVLRIYGYEVATAADGVDALEQLAEEAFDLVLTDRQMPNLDGVSMVLALRSAGSVIPIIMFSGSLAHEPLPAAVASEFFAAIPKPARTPEVLSAVAAALDPAPPRQDVHQVLDAHLLAA